MRHDPAARATAIKLRSLKTHGIARAVTSLIGQRAPASEAAVPMLSQLVKAAQFAAAMTRLDLVNLEEMG